VTANVMYHLLEAVAAGLAEAGDDEDLAERLHARTKLRLMTMSDEQILELASIIAIPQGKPVQHVFHEFKQATEACRATMREWVGDL